MALAYGAVGTPVYSTGNPAPGFPAGGTSGKYLYILYVGTKPDTTPATTPAGWTLLGAFSGGAGTTGIDTGPMRVGVFIRGSTTVLTGTVTVTVTGNNVSAAWIERYDCATTEGFDVAITGGADTTAGAAYSVVTASVAADFVKTGDLLSICRIIPTDTNPTYGTPTLTAQGGGTITLGTLTTRATLTTASGQDMGGQQRTAAPTVTSQLAGTLTLSQTDSGTTTNNHGPLALVRVRAVTAPTAPTSAPTVVEATEAVNVTTPATLQGGATSYNLYRSGVQIATGLGAGVQITDTGQDATVARTYTARGVNAAGEGADSPASASVTPYPNFPAFSLETGLSGRIDVTITRRAYAAVYKVYRAPSGDSPVLVHTSTSQAANGTYAWNDTGLTNGVSYDYTVTTTAQTPTVRESGWAPIQSATPLIISYLRPNGTGLPGGSAWVPVPSGTGTHHLRIDEVILDTADYMQMAENSSGYVDIFLTAPVEPPDGSSVKIVVHWQQFTGSSSSVALLREDTSVVASFSLGPKSTAGYSTFQLDAAQRASITTMDYNNLRLRFDATMGTSGLIIVHQAYVEVGSAAAPPPAPTFAAFGIPL